MKRLPGLTFTLALALLYGCGGGPADSPASVQRVIMGESKPVDAQTLTLPGNRGSYLINKQADGYVLTNSADGGVIHASTNVKRIQFSDVSLALDIDVAGKVYRLYQAAFNRTPDIAGIGYWLGVLDHGATLESIALNFIQSAEFKQLYGSAPTDTEFLTRLYLNVLHRAPDSDGLKYWLTVLSAGTSRAAVLVQFSESAENASQVAPTIADGVAYAQTTIDYTPVANAGQDIQAAVGQVVKLSGSGSTDANNDPLTFAWTLTKPDSSNAVLLAPTSSSPSLIVDVAGIYTATLKVSDGKLFSEPKNVSILVSAPVVVTVPDTGTYKCSQISHALALQLFSQGHTYLDRDHDGKPCEASDIAVETQTATPGTAPTSPSSGMCYVNGYYRKNGTYVKGYWRRC